MLRYIQGGTRGQEEDADDEQPATSSSGTHQPQPACRSLDSTTVPSLDQPHSISSLGTEDACSINMVRTVAVIGAGPSGLTSIKSCLEEGLEPTCFESSEDIGGLWRFKEVSEPNRASIYRSLTINTSKELLSYSDFPIPADYPNYMHHSRVLQYFRLYAEHFKLLQHICFQTTVQSVRQRPDFSHSGQWEVVTENSEGEKETHIFDSVIICSGHYTYPHLPLKDFPGQQ
ncbi:hypothetical protein UPYG_G00028590 [Umbra pygmaea]|uniref:Flavin-containing monooxygenase n=1 Tax=Umbra pygmaea TaxID=75934 RepID=A0ABD0Y642_UMBPY